MPRGVIDLSVPSVRPLCKGLLDSRGEGVDGRRIGVDVPDDLELQLAPEGYCEALGGESWWGVAGEGAGAEQPSVAGCDVGDDGGEGAERRRAAGRWNSGVGELLEDQVVDVRVFGLIGEVERQVSEVSGIDHVRSG